MKRYYYDLHIHSCLSPCGDDDNTPNNIVGMAIMVENTVVFGNKYRSTYPDIDSELTRAELCFRNGEYTQALTIAISTIEKIFPDTYEKLIKENAKSAA